MFSTSELIARLKESWKSSLFLLFFILFLGYAGFVEPYRVEVTHHVVDAPVRSKIRIMHLTDLHIREMGIREEKVLEAVRSERPDAILISGDFVSAYADSLVVQEFLASLSAPLGVWGVPGNWDRLVLWRNEEAFFRQTGIRYLRNSSAQLMPGIWILGFDDATRGVPNIPKTFSRVPLGVYKIALFHSPVFFDAVAHDVDLALAGHTHGGQVRLPGLRPLYLPRGCGPYLEGWYFRDRARLYVSRGIGTSIIDVRLFARPEIAIIDLLPMSATQQR